MLDPQRRPAREHPNDQATLPHLQIVPRPLGRIPYHPRAWYDTLGSAVVYIGLGAFALIILWALFGR
jgi:hypothetical protein